MKIKTTKRNENRFEFNITGINPPMANALRRAIISKIPVMAIEEIKFYDNSSILNDEVLAHRLGLIPLKTDLKTYDLMDDCTCRKRGCAKCTTSLTLEMDGPGTAHSGDLKSTDENVKPVHDKIPITKLTERQSLKLEATAQLGMGGEHIKWQGGLASYGANKNDSIDFFVESFGQLSIEEMLDKSFEVVQKDIDDLKSHIS